MSDSTIRTFLSRSSLTVLIAFALTSGLLMGMQRADYPGLHTILDTGASLLSVVLAWQLWDAGIRVRRPFLTWLGISFAVTSFLELLHVLVTDEWVGSLAWIARAQSLLRPSTWPPAVHVLPMGIISSLWLLNRAGRGATVFATALMILSAALLALFLWLPRYTAPHVFGITRPALILAPVLWIVVGWQCWRLRSADPTLTDRILRPLALIAAVLFVAHAAMLYSRAPHDTEAMVAHLGKVSGYLILLISLMQSATTDMLERDRAERRILQLNEALEERVQQVQLNTELQRAYDDLRRSHQSAMQQERLRVLGQMASGIAHDINNALSPVALYTDALLEREPGVSARGREYLTTIQRAIEDVAETVARMREFHRPLQPQVVLAHVNINLLVQQVMDLTRARWCDQPQHRGIVIHFETHLAAGLPPVLGAEADIRHALTNLIFNAVDAMPAGGKLTICTKELPAQENVTEASRACVEVSDTGVGMSEEARKHCLEPFFTTKGERGTGLGLAMVYGMVQRHGGDLQIESELGSGTTLRLAFPAASAAMTASARAPELQALLRRLRVLIVDDDPIVMESLRDSLLADGHFVTAADGGQAGIDAFVAAEQRGEPFAIVFTDLGMPIVDGRKVAATIRAASPTTPIVLLTGWGQRLTSERDVPAEVSRLLSKPPKLRDLRAALAELT